MAQRPRTPKAASVGPPPRGNPHRLVKAGSNPWLVHTIPSPSQIPLFDLGKVPLAQPHEQRLHEFAKDQRTWWHGRYVHPDTTDLRDASGSAASAAGGLHLGTRASAEDRLGDKGPGGMVDPEGNFQTFASPARDNVRQAEGRLYPMRIIAQMGNTVDNPDRDQGATWSQVHSRGRYYSNESEDFGSISARVPGRRSVMSHRQFVDQAQAEGQYVRPGVLHDAAMAAKYGEHADTYTHPYQPPEQPKFDHPELFVTVNPHSKNPTYLSHEEWAEHKTRLNAQEPRR